MNWFKNRKNRNLAIDNVTLAKNGLYFNLEVNKNLQISKFNFAQVAITGTKTFCVQFTVHRMNEATNYKVALTTKNAIKVSCIQFVDKYFNAREDVKHAKLQVKERDDQHLLIECTVEGEYNGTI